LTLPQKGGTLTAIPASADGYYAANTSIQLTASANAGYLFSNWNGDLAGTNISQTLTMTAPRAVTANFPSILSHNVSLNPGGAATEATDGSRPIRTGYLSVNLKSGTAPYGTAVFSFKQNGATVSEAGVPASPPTTHARIFIDYRVGVPAIPGRSAAGNIDVNTGIAAVNCGSNTAHVTYVLYNRNNVAIAAGIGTISAGAHIAKFIDQLFETAPDFNLPSDFQSSTQFASLDISSDQPLSVLALRMTTNQNGDGLFTTTPVADLNQSLTYDPIYFPHFVDGGGYTTSLILLNTSASIETGTLQFFDNNGHPLDVHWAGSFTSSALGYSIPAGGFFILQTDGSPENLKSGWVRLMPNPGSSTPLGSGVFGFNTQDKLVSESGIPAALSTTHARVFVDLRNNHNTGLAISNLTSGNSSITVRAFQMDGATPAGSSLGPLQLSGYGHDAKFADAFINGLPDEFIGVLDVSSNSPFAALTLRSLTNERDDFLMTTFPIADATRSAPFPIVFPHIVDGGGYTTEFILLNPTGVAETSIGFFDENGAPNEF
jgi:hypothetical protein